jgi:hypothetical protein
MARQWFEGSYFMRSSSNSPLDWWSSIVSGNFTQPILPGWFGSVYNVTLQNSSAPEAEAEVVAKHSYGRQLGRIMDALSVLIARLPEAERHARAITKFNEIHQEIDDIKADVIAGRLENLASDLATLKERNPREYDRIAAKLNDALWKTARQS